MALIDDVKNLCDRLAPLGWRDLLLAVTSKIPTVSNTTRPVWGFMSWPLGSARISE